MATVVDMTQFDAWLKELYPSGVPQDLALKNHVFLSKVRKEGNFVGEQIVWPILYEYPQGRSATIATVLGASGPIGASKGVRMNVTRSKDYAATFIDSETIMATTDMGAFASARKFELDNLLKQLGNSMGHAIYRSGTGAITQVAGTEAVAVGAVTTFTCSPITDARHIAVGMQLDFADEDVSGSIRAGGVRTVTAVNLDTGVVTVDAVLTTPAVEGLDYVYATGDRGLKMKGIAAWLPLTAPTGGDSFFGVDRSVHPTRLAGMRLDQPTYPPEENILELAERIAEQGGTPDWVMISHRTFTKLVKRLGAKIEIENGENPKVGFAYITMVTSAGVLRVYPDPDCPDNLGYVLSSETWVLRHLGEFPHIVRDDGLAALRRDASDSIEIRARYYGQLLCSAPGHNGVFSVG